MVFGDVELALLEPAPGSVRGHPAERGDVRLAGTADDGLVQERRRRDHARFHLAPGHLLPVRQLEDGVDTAEELEAVLGPFAEIAAVQPAALLGAAAFPGAIAISAHHLRPADEDLAAGRKSLDGRELHGGAGERTSDHA